MTTAAGAVIEVAGIDGSGKSTLARELAGRLIGAGAGAYVRGLHSWVRRSATSLARRRGHDRGSYIGHDAVEFAVAMELLERSTQLRVGATDGATFILDPYTYSSAAVAATHRVRNIDAILDVYFDAHRPDLVVYLDLDPATAYERILTRPGSDNVTLRGGVADLRKYQASFERIAGPFRHAGFRITNLDATRPTGELATAVLGLLPELGRRTVAG